MPGHSHPSKSAWTILCISNLNIKKIENKSVQLPLLDQLSTAFSLCVHHRSFVHPEAIAQEEGMGLPRKTTQPGMCDFSADGQYTFSNVYKQQQQL
jgi:hypothetical protein